MEELRQRILSGVAEGRRSAHERGEQRSYGSSHPNVRRKWSFRRLKEHVHSNFEHGIVLHLPRLRGEDATNGRPEAFQRSTTVDPDVMPQPYGQTVNVFGYRYSDFYRQTRSMVDAVAPTLLEMPLSLSIIRGVDPCTDELAVPNWVMRTLLNHLRRAAMMASEWISQQNLGFRLPPIRTTVHAGEDFVHLLGGLRRVDEAVTFLGLREGDRIGHAMTLGVDAQAWAKSVGRVAIPTESRWLDLIWEWRFAARQTPGTWISQVWRGSSDRSRQTEFKNG